MEPAPVSLPTDERAEPDRTPLPRGERVGALLAAFSRLTGTTVRLTAQRPDGETILFDGFGRAGDADSGPAGIPEATGDEERIRSPDGVLRSETWAMSDGGRVRVDYLVTDGDEGLIAGELLRESLGPLLSSEMEVDFFARELGTRFEEVELLTSVSDTLGSMVGMERAAQKLLGSMVTVLGAATAEIWVSDPEGMSLSRFAHVRGDGGAGARGPGTIPDVNSDPSPLARAFADGKVESGIDTRGEEGPHTPWLLVPLRHTALHGTAGAVGMMKLRGAEGREPFRPRDARLASAVASHLAAALENRRLLTENVERERMLVELALAHDLQLKLLPEPDDFRGLADIAARCDPADSVGGDFYHLFRLPGDRLGVMLGDVSSHGYSAGLIMALTMSAASLVAREHDDPAEALSGIHRELVRKLESTEMYMTICYVVLDPAAGVLRYANAGHPHAWRIRDGDTDRLEALNPPLGIAEFDRYGSREVPWTPGSDTLLLFTDGLSECLGAGQMWSDDVLTRGVLELSNAGASEVLNRLFELADLEDGEAVDDRTAVVVK